MSEPTGPRPIPVPAWDNRDTVLGQFMDAWSSLENQLFMLFWILTGTNAQTARAIFATGFQMRDLRELLMALGESRLEIGERKTLEALCDRIGSAATKRNRIVHGKWIWETVIGPENDEHGRPTLTSLWVRFYDPISPSIAAQIMHKQNQKIRSAYRFEIAQLADATAQVHAVQTDVGIFSQEVIQRLYPNGLPE